MRFFAYPLANVTRRQARTVPCILPPNSIRYPRGRRRKIRGTPIYGHNKPISIVYSLSVIWSHDRHAWVHNSRLPRAKGYTSILSTNLLIACRLPGIQSDANV